jgi:RHS repeat-associated protein
METGSGANARRYYLHANHLYSIAALSDSTGTVVERYQYDAMGQRTILAANGITVLSASAYGNQIGFTGRYHDDETGLQYFRSRMYSASLGRFISRDSAGYVNGMNFPPFRGQPSKRVIAVRISPCQNQNPLPRRLINGDILMPLSSYSRHS